MSLLGSDVDELRALAGAMRRAQRDLDRIDARWSRHNRSVPWWGPDARRFESEWQGRHRPQIASVTSSLARLADRLDGHSAEQVEASSSGAGVSLPPRSEARYSGTFDARIGLALVSTTGELTIADIGEGRRRVTWSEGAGIGATSSIGASSELSVGGPHGATGGPNGANATLSGRVGVVGRSSWDVDADDVDGLLARLVADRASQEATGVRQPISKVASGLDKVVETLTGVDPGLDVGAAALAPPVAARSEQLLELDVTASAGLGTSALMGLGVRGNTASTVRVGVSRGEGGNSRIVELRGATNASGAATLLRRVTGSLPLEFHTAGTLRIEQPVDAPDRLTLRASTVERDSVRDIVAVVQLSDGDAERTTAALRSSFTAAQRGDAAGAAMLLGTLDLDLSRIEVASSTGTIQGHSARASAAAAIGVGGGVTLRGSAVQIERTD